MIEGIEESGSKEAFDNIPDIRAIWLIHNPFSPGRDAADLPRRVEGSMKNNTTKRFNPEQVHTSTVKKSLAI